MVFSVKKKLKEKTYMNFLEILTLHPHFDTGKGEKGLEGIKKTKKCQLYILDFFFMK